MALQVTRYPFPGYTLPLGAAAIGREGLGTKLHFLVGPKCVFIAVFFVGNDISKVEGLEGLQELRELVLDRNKIKVMKAQ